MAEAWKSALRVVTRLGVPWHPLTWLKAKCKKNKHPPPKKKKKKKHSRHDNIWESSSS